MRIFEITDKNKVIIEISNINLDFESDYTTLIKLLSLMIRLASPSRTNRALINIQEFEDRIHGFQQNKLLDRSDPDIIELLKKLDDMQTHVNHLKSQLGH